MRISLLSLLQERRRLGAKQQYERLRDELVEQYDADDAQIAANSRKQEEDRSAERVLSRLATGLNLLLLGGNLTASVLSGSLAIISTFIDSAMDLTSNVIISVCLFLIHRTNPFLYPRGRDRLELIGVLICSILMGIANVVVIFQAVLAIASRRMDARIDYFSGGLMLGGAALKVALAIVCFGRGTPASRVLAMDMRNDAVACLTAFLAALIAHFWWQYADPLGAILVCSVIAYNWFSHAVENIPQLVGVRGDSQLLSRVIRVAMMHDTRIEKIDHAMVYQTGSAATVELHVVLDKNMPLKVVEPNEMASTLRKRMTSAIRWRKSYSAWMALKEPTSTVTTSATAITSLKVLLLHA